MRHHHAHADPADEARIAAITRARFALPADARVSIHERAGTAPGLPLGTHVAFWTFPGTRHEFTVFKPAAQVVEADLPPAFMKRALVADDDAPCC